MGSNKSDEIRPVVLNPSSYWNLTEKFCVLFGFFWTESWPSYWKINIGDFTNPWAIFLVADLEALLNPLLHRRANFCYFFFVSIVPVPLEGTFQTAQYIFARIGAELPQGFFFHFSILVNLVSTELCWQDEQLAFWSTKGDLLTSEDWKQNCKQKRESM